MAFSDSKKITHGKTPVTLLEMEFGKVAVTIDSCDSLLTSDNYGTGTGYYVLSVDNADYREGTGSNYFDFKAPSGVHKQNDLEQKMNGTAWCGYFTGNGTLISFTTAPVDLSGREKVVFYGKATGAGMFLRLWFGENNWNENYRDIIFEEANTWEQIELDVSDIPDANKDSLTQWAFEVINSPHGLNEDVWIDGIEGKNVLRFSDKPVKFGHLKYEPRIIAVDDVEHALENWEGELQVAKSGVRLADFDNFLKSLRKDNILKNRTGTIKVGFQGDSYDDYVKVFEGKIRDESINKGELSLTLEDAITKYDKIVPKRFYSKLLYASMEDDFQGQPIPYSIGRLYNITPACINTTTGRYKLCDHKVKSITEVRYDGEPVEFTPDLDNGEFTLDLQTTFSIGFEATPAILSKSDNRLVTYVPATYDVLDIDLTHASYDTLQELCSYINSKDGYSASLIGNPTVKSIYLENVQSQDFSATYTFSLQVPESSSGMIEADFVGLPDDSSGTYTGSANATLENPADVIYCVANNALFGEMPSTEIDTSQLVSLRQEYSGFRVCRHIDSTISIFNLLSELGRDCFIWIYANENGKLTAQNAKTDRWGAEIHDCDTLLDDGTVDHGGDQYVANTVDSVNKEEGEGSNKLKFKTSPTRHKLNSTQQMNATGYIGWYSVTGSKIRWTTSPIDLRHSGDYIYFYAMSDTVGTYMRISLGSTGWGQYSHDIQITQADTWQLVGWDISGIPDSVLADVRYWQLELINADTGINMNFWIDFIRASEFSDYYWEDGKYARIKDGTLQIDSTIEDIWNKFNVLSGYDYAEGVYTQVASLEDVTSQDSSLGYGVSETYSVKAKWLPDDFDVVRIKYTGLSATATLSITGEGGDTTNVLSTSCSDSSDDLNIELGTQTYETLSSLVDYINNQDNYSMELIDSSYGSLDPLGLRSVTSVDITATRELKFGEGKLLAERLKEKYSTGYDRYKFVTSLYGVGEGLGIAVGVKSINDTDNTRVRIKRAIKKPSEYCVEFYGTEEPIRID